MAASIIEPLTFQLLRHLGALMGWWTVLTGDATWGHTARRSLHQHQSPPSPPLEDEESELKVG